MSTSPYEHRDAATSLETALTFYPAFAHQAHPLYSHTVPLTAATLSKLHQPSGYQGMTLTVLVQTDMSNGSKV